MDAPPITLGREEQRRLYVLDELTAGRLTTIEAAVALDVSIRHLQRLKARYQREGMAALSHGNRGRRPWNAISDDLAGQVVELARTRYAGLNHSHLADLLAEREGLGHRAGAPRRQPVGQPRPASASRSRRPPADAAQLRARHLSRLAEQGAEVDLDLLTNGLRTPRTVGRRPSKPASDHPWRRRVP